MSDASTVDPYVTLTVAPDTGLGFILDSMEATEELGRPFLIALDVSSQTPKGDLHAMLGSTATVALSYPQRTTRYFSGVVARVSYRGLTGGGYKYRLELRPWIWLLSQQQDCRIFSAKSPWTIMTDLFRDAGFTDFEDKRQNAAGDAVMDYCVQYRESTLDFVTRLMEQCGIYYYVTHKDGSHVIAFADDPNSHTAATDPIPYRYSQTRWRTAEDHVWDWSADAEIQPGAYALREYNFTTPKADLTAKSLIAGEHTYGSNEVYDYPGRYETADDGQKVAQVRMQDYATRRQVYGGTSNSRVLGAGGKFTLSDFPDSAANQEYLVIASVCSVQRAETRAFKDDEEIVDTFRCVLRAVPGSRPFRLPNTTPRPLIRGPQTARVAGESGQEVTTDQYGRIKVKFPWDRRTTEDENSSCWIRVAQIWAGQAWGAMFIPRIGQEVVVEFLEGNPDRPLVTGQVYNADMTVPYALPDNKTRSTVKSNSSLNGGGFNELRFEDKKDSEEVFLQAQKDYNVVVLNSHTAKITQDTTTTVDKGNRVVTVSKGNDTHTVSEGNREATVTKGNETLTVSQGDQSTEVTAGTSTTEAGTKILLKVAGCKIEITKTDITAEASTKITLKVGGSSIEISNDGIAVKSPQVKLTGDAAVELSAPQVKVSATADLALNGGLHAALKAAMVEIN